MVLTILSDLRPTVVCFVNALIEGINQPAQHLPKYVIIMPDKDILDGMIHVLSISPKKILKKTLQWLVAQVGRILKN